MSPSTVVLLVSVVLASSVEAVEALTIILASGITRGWRSTFEGAAVAFLALGAIVGGLGPALVNFVPINILRLVVGVLLLIFGLQWLRKAILRASGYKALHDEAAIYQREVNELSKAPKFMQGRRDPVAFTISFKGVFLEGMEIVVIVISFGVPAGQLGLCSLAAAAAVVVIAIIGAFTAKPLAKMPENTMKLGVGVILATFGTFWMAEGARVEWPGGDLFLLVLVAAFTASSLGMIAYLKRSKAAQAAEEVARDAVR